MKKLLAIVALVLAFAVPAAAQTGCDALEVNGLPESVVIELKKKCLDLAKPVTSISVDSMGEYAELGKKYGIALSEVAKSVGTTVNELAQTPVGKFMLVMVAYRVMGDDVIGVAGGVIWFATMIPIWIYMFHRLVFGTRRVRTRVRQDGETETDIEPIDFNGTAGAISIWMLFVMFLICLSGFFMIFG